MVSHIFTNLSCIIILFKKVFHTYLLFIKSWFSARNISSRSIKQEIGKLHSAFRMAEVKLVFIFHFQIHSCLLLEKLFILFWLCWQTIGIIIIYFPHTTRFDQSTFYTIFTFYLLIDLFPIICFPKNSSTRYKIQIVSLSLKYWLNK